jgi:hypothetical protein
MDGTMMIILTGVLRLIEKIPATFWGVVIGSFFTLGGVMLTNRANNRRLREQLRHDRELRNRDRELSLRKDVYMSAAEAIWAGLFAVGRFGDLDIPNNKITEAYMEKSPAIAKVHVIANEKILRAQTDLVSELNATYMRLFAKRVPLITQKMEISNLQQKIDSFRRDTTQMLELMKQFNLDGATDQRRWNVIEGHFKFAQDRIAEISKELATLFADLSQKQLRYIEECIGEANRLNRLVVPVVVAVRTELDIPINEAAYMELMEESNKRQEASLNNFMKKMRSLLTAPQEAPPDSEQSGSQ